MILKRTLSRIDWPSKILATGMLLALLSNTAVWGQQRQIEARLYFPLALGNTWRFTNTAGSESVTQVTRLEKVHQEEGFRLETSVGNRVISSEVLALRSDGIYRLAANDVPIQTPILLLKNPIQLNDSWSFQSRVKDRTIQGKLAVQALDEEVVTRAGKFKCVKIGGDSLQLDNQKVALTYWLAPNVGPVKISVKIGEQETTLELTDFKPASTEPSPEKPGTGKPGKPEK